MKRIGHSFKVLSEADQKVYSWLLSHDISQRYAYFSSAYLDHDKIHSMLYKAKAMCCNPNAQVTLHGLFCAYMRLEFLKKEIYYSPYHPAQTVKNHIDDCQKTNSNALCD